MPSGGGAASGAARSFVVAIALLAAFHLACLRDFSIFEPVAESDAGSRCRVQPR